MQTRTRIPGLTAAVVVAFLGCSIEDEEALPPRSHADAGSPTTDAAPPPSADGSAQQDAIAIDASTIDAADAAPLDPRDGPGIFAGVGNHVRHVRSLDYGLTWIDDATDIDVTNVGDLYGIRTTSWGDGKFVAYAAKVVTSLDGKTWTEVQKDNGQWLASMLYADGQWVSSGGYGWLATTTTDLGNGWTQHAPVLDYTTGHHSRGALAHGTVNGASAYVVVNDNGELFHANDGKTWLPSSGVTPVPAGNTWGTVFTFGGGVFVGILPNGMSTIRSVDGGATWSTNTPFATSAQGLIYAQGHFLALGSGHVFTSVDGQAWVDQPATSARNADLVYGHGTFLALDNGTIYRSTDGLAWTHVFDSSTKPDGIASIAFGPF